MNVKQSVPRVDCIHFAKCGKKSIAHCREYRETDEECTGCKLIEVRSSKNYKTMNGVVTTKRCSKCGQFLSLHWFYKRYVKKGTKVYHTYSSACKICVNKPKQD